MKYLLFIILSLMFSVTVIAEPFSEAPVLEVDVVTLSMEDCVKYALLNSFEVKLAKLDLYIAETQVMYSEAVFDTFLYGGAVYEEDKRQQLSVFAADDQQTNFYNMGITKTLPTGTEVNAELSTTRLWQNTIFISKNPSFDSQFSLDLKQPVGRNSFGYIDRKRISISKLAVENSSLETQDKIEALIVKTEKSYLDLIYAKENRDIIKRIRDKARSLFESEEKNFDLGTIEKVELLAVEANLAQREAELIVAENNYERAKANLKLIMNLSDTKDIIPGGNMKKYSPTKDISYFLHEAFKHRRDYLIRKRDIDIKGLDLKISENSMWPEIDLTLTLATNGLERGFEHASGKVTVADNTYYSAGIKVTIPIENSQPRSEFIKSRYEKEKAIVKLKEVERIIITDVSNAYNDVVAFEKSIFYTEKAVELQSSKLEEEEKRYRYGRSNIKRLVDYQQDLLRAELENSLFTRDNLKAKVDLERSMNSILNKYEGLL